MFDHKIGSSLEEIKFVIARELANHLRAPPPPTVALLLVKLEFETIGRYLFCSNVDVQQLEHSLCPTPIVFLSMDRSIKFPISISPISNLKAPPPAAPLEMQSRNAVFMILIFLEDTVAIAPPPPRVSSLLSSSVPALF